MDQDGVSLASLVASLWGQLKNLEQAFQQEQLKTKKLQEALNASQEREAAEVYGSGARPKANGEEDKDWDVGEAAQRFREENLSPGLTEG